MCICYTKKRHYTHTHTDFAAYTYIFITNSQRDWKNENRHLDAEPFGWCDERIEKVFAIV